MQLLRRYPARAAAAAALALLLAACTDRSDPANPNPPGGGEDPGSGDPLTVQLLECVGNVRAKRFDCALERPSTGEASGDIDIVSNTHVQLTSSNVDYDGAAFTFNTTVRNLIPQPLGTTDGVSLDPGGVKVVIVYGPVVQSGSGTITVVPDGTAAFADLARLNYPNIATTPKPYYQYNTVLDQFELSAPRTWQFNMPPTVTTFKFKVAVLAPVQYPRGYVDITGNNQVRSGMDRQLTGVVRDSVGRAVAGKTITWGTADALLASVDNTGKVHGNRAGLVSITGQSEIRPGVFVPGDFDMTVRPIRRFWTGAAGTTDWFTGNNWSPDNIVPVATDTAVVADTITPPAANYPVLTANASIGGVEVEKESIHLSAFNLTASGDVFTDLIDNAEITNTSGRLILTGIARTIRGRVPPIVVEGTYSLDGNLNVRAPLQVLRGRLTNQSFRVQVQSF